MFSTPAETYYEMNGDCVFVGMKSDTIIAGYLPVSTTPTRQLLVLRGGLYKKRHNYSAGPLKITYGEKLNANPR